MRSLDDYLAALGPEYRLPSGWQTTTAQSITSDGRHIVAEYTFPQFAPSLWLKGDRSFYPHVERTCLCRFTLPASPNSRR